MPMSLFQKVSIEYLHIEMKEESEKRTFTASHDAMYVAELSW